MTVSVFVGTSVDGFIARPNGDLDWLPAGGGEPHGYDEFIASVDAIVIGRKTFEKGLTFGAWPYGDKRVVVQSESHVATYVLVSDAEPCRAKPSYRFVAPHESKLLDSIVQIKSPDLTSPRFKANPYPFYAHLRAESPVYRFRWIFGLPA